ncbi:ribonuclease H-like domain-containing protein [Ilyonectria robusta]|uniref:ribonuclease H-like domain-containing protein n=1 Tax=Ilyonectria robusta TaxID=1079257 RepID=UPI001E8D8FD4|nr:ribonuclease H-like domain-containing protein [Ilyonectria robusta]KAH8663850.1 ribonuclease H-like domain-containing protein [Ilyonectria robusta]
MSHTSRRRKNVSGHSRQKEIVHDKHGPHNGGQPPHTRPGEHFPGECYTSHGINSENLEVKGHDFDFIHLRCPFSSPEPCSCGRHSYHMDSMIVAVDGACPGNGSHKAVASGCGVWFGPRSADSDNNTIQPNLSFRVPDDPIHPHTSQRAELHAAIAGLESSMKFATHGGHIKCEVPDSCPEPCRITHLIIKSDSAYIVNAMTGSLWKWLNNGWLTTKKTPVKNKDLWELLFAGYSLLVLMGVTVDFWHVPREKNAEADSLARQGVHSQCTYGGEKL